MKKKYYKTPAFATEESIQAAFPSIVTGVAKIAAAASATSTISPRAAVAATLDGGPALMGTSFMRSHHNESTIPALIKVYD